MISSKTFSAYGRVATLRDIGKNATGNSLIKIRRETHGESFVVVVVTLSLIHFLFNRYN